VELLFKITEAVLELGLIEALVVELNPKGIESQTVEKELNAAEAGTATTEPSVVGLIFKIVKLE
jgi:hypothetical protein